MMRKVISIIFYVISGFFFYMVCLLAFMNPPVKQLPVLVKFALIGGFSIPALIAMGIGLACSRFQNWKRDIGIITISAAGFTTFMVLTIICMLISPEFKELYPDNKFEFFSDYVTGTGCIIILGTIGVLLIKIGKNNAEQSTAS